MNIARIFGVTVLLGVLSTASVGQESKTQPAPPKPAAEQAKPSPSTPADAPKSTPPAAQAPAGPRKSDDGEFIPTEELQPDEDVTFPVDI